MFNEYYQPLCNYALKFTKDLDKAEDMVQDVFVKLWNRKQIIDKEKNWTSYLFLMVKNQCLDEYKRNNIGAKVTQEYYKVNDKEVYLTVDDKEVEYYLMLEKLNQSIQALPPKCREIFTLNKLQGVTQIEIADSMGISIKTVEAQMAKAYKIIKASLVTKLILFIIFS